MPAGSNVRIFDRHATMKLVGTTYDTPDTLGLDRILNVAGQSGDGVVISFGTAITVDACVGGVPRWGSIAPGISILAEALSDSIAVLPIGDNAHVHVPARTSVASVSNGVVLGAVEGAHGLAERLVAPVPLETLRVVLTGGDAAIALSHWRWTPPLVDEALLFRGAMNVLGSDGGD
jgi:pantothenate kinase type III